jgi:beta-phosphoglucomutase-like phosphatase (HAD superfamily)
VLKELELDPQQCIAIEDSENGLQSALAANLPTLITISSYTRSQDFSGARAVLSDLGEPDKPFTLIDGKPLTKQWIDYNELKELLK